MLQKLVLLAFSLIFLISLISCENMGQKGMQFSGVKGEVKLITVDPGHFHAALVQKVMYAQIAPVVHVYAPQGADVTDHIKRIEGFNTRTENPTSWEEKVYTGPDFLTRMVREKPGNVVIFSGKNHKKTEYIKAAVDAGLNVLADKPMCMNKVGFELLKQAFASAREQNVLLYDIMTERYEITTILQKELAAVPTVFGELKPGSPEEPTITKESVHHFFKFVAGNPIKRPGWYFDVAQQGEGLIDVTTHLVDLVQWECFPEQLLDYRKDIEMLSARHWPTLITREQYEKVTRLPDFPEYLQKYINPDGVLEVFSNGSMLYKIKGIHAKISVVWKYQAPEGTGDTHFSIMRGTKADLIIKQGQEQNYKPELYVKITDEAHKDAIESALKNTISQLQSQYPGVALQPMADVIRIRIPNQFRIGHEAHFGQVTLKYLKFLTDGKLPEWEVPNMIAKYYTTTAALEMASGK